METTKLARQGQAAAATVSDMAAPILRRTSGELMRRAGGGIDAFGNLVSQARNAATDASDTIVAYTKKNPVKALAIAAVAGALLFTIAKANALRRD